MPFHDSNPSRNTGGDAARERSESEIFRDDLLNGSYLPERPEEARHAVSFDKVMEAEHRSVRLRRAAMADPDVTVRVHFLSNAVGAPALESRIRAVAYLADNDPELCKPVVERLIKDLQRPGQEQGFLPRMGERLSGILPESWRSTALSGRMLAAETLVEIVRRVDLGADLQRLVPALDAVARDTSCTQRVRVVAIHGLVVSDAAEAYSTFQALDSKRSPFEVRRAAHYAMNAFDLMHESEAREQYFVRLARKPNA